MAKSRKRPAEAWVYVLKADRDLAADQQSRFTLRPMTFAERASVRDSVASEPTTRVYRTAGEIMLDHVVSIENFPVGEPAPWPVDRAARAAYLDLLDDDDVLEIGNEVWRRSSLGTDGAIIKNSSPPEPTSTSGGISPAIEPSTPVEAATAIQP